MNERKVPGHLQPRSDAELSQSEMGRLLANTNFSAGRSLQQNLREQLSDRVEKELPRLADRTQRRHRLFTRLQWVGEFALLIVFVLGLSWAIKNFTPAVSGVPVAQTPSSTQTPQPTQLPATAAPSLEPVTRYPTPTIPIPTPTPIPEVVLPVVDPAVRLGKGIVTALAVSPDGRWMAVGTPFGVYQYRADSFEQAWFTPLPSKAWFLAFDPSSQRLGVLADGNIYILDAETGSTIIIIQKAYGAFAWSPDGARLVTGSSCQTVTVWDAASGASLAELRGGMCSEGYSGISAAWTADGRIYAAAGMKFFAWDGQTYEPLEISAQGAPGTWVGAVLAAPVGSLLAHYDGMGSPVVAIIDTESDRQIRLLDPKIGAPIVALAWVPDGRRLAVSYGMNTAKTLIWDAQTGQVEQTIEGYYPFGGLGWMPDGQSLLGLQNPDGQITAIDMKTSQILRSLSGHASHGSYLTWGSDGIRATNGIQFTLWDPASGLPKGQETVGAANAWVISWPDSRSGLYLYYDWRGNYLAGSPRSQQSSLELESNYPMNSAWSPDGTRLANASQVWDTQTNQLLAQLQDPNQQHTPDTVAWSPDGTRLASADSLNIHPPVIWDAKSGKILLSLDASIPEYDPAWTGLAWSPDGKWLAGVGWLKYKYAVTEEEGLILLWNTETGKQGRILTTAMHNRLNAVAWSPDGRYLAVGTTGSELFVWDMLHFTPLASLQGHRDIIEHLVWSPDSSQLASVSRDGMLAIWNLAALK